MIIPGMSLLPDFMQTRRNPSSRIPSTRCCSAGKFDACYFDNGTQYIAKQIKISLSRLGIRILHAPIRSGKSKGKIEKFHQVVDRFLREIQLKPVRSLDETQPLVDALS